MIKGYYLTPEQMKLLQYIALRNASVRKHLPTKFDWMLQYFFGIDYDIRKNYGLRDLNFEITYYEEGGRNALNELRTLYLKTL